MLNFSPIVKVVVVILPVWQQLSDAGSELSFIRQVAVSHTLSWVSL